MKLLIAGESSCGMTRSVNEDRFVCLPGTAAVIDGMGGLAHGALAADIAAEVCRIVLSRTAMPVYERLHVAMVAMNNAVCFASRHMEAGMGAVAVIAAVENGRLHYIHVGDARLYLRSGTGGRLYRRTFDHSVSACSKEDEALANGASHQVTQYLGAGIVKGSARLGDYSECPFAAGDSFLLCSDGLYGPVPLQRIGAIAETFGTDARRAAECLVEAANAAGGPDNVTVVLAVAEATPVWPHGQWPGLLKMLAAGVGCAGSFLAPVLDN